MSQFLNNYNDIVFLVKKRQLKIDLSLEGYIQIKIRVGKHKLRYFLTLKVKEIGVY